jgi:excinuclease UvrABC ATPase subunit
MNKLCAHCNKEKPVTEYYKRAQLADGLSSYCKECWKELNQKRKRKLYKQQAEYRKDNADKRAKNYKKYWAEHKEEILAKRRAKYHEQKKEAANKAAPKTKTKPGKT